MFRFLQTGLKGQNHRTLYIPLPGDSDTNKVEFKMEPIENGVQEGSFEKYRKQNRDDILVAHQVPLSKLGGSDSAAIAAALAQDRTFKEQVARPAQRNLEKMVNKIIREKTDVVDFKFNELTLTDEIAQSQILERYIKTQIMVPNEAREVLGLPQRQGGDEPYQPKPGLKGQNHRTLYIPLPGDSDTNKVEFKMEPIENGVQEGSFEKYRKQNRDDILVAHQVPLSKLGGSDSAAIAAALAQDRTFKEQVARPAQRNLEKMVNKIIREKTDVVDFKFNELTLTDEIAQSQILERYIKTQIMVPNEAREVLGLPQRQGGDEPYQPKPDQLASENSNSARDAQRLNNQSDGAATIAGRNPKGEGRASQ